MHDVIDIIKNIQGLYENNSSLSVLKDFERVLDELDLYVFANWEDGEIAYGPKVERHWITVGLMWPYAKMPDPAGGKRLVDAGCEVTYQKSHLLEPRPIRTQDDIRPNSKKGKMDRNPIWIVEIQMPKKVAFDMFNGYMENIKPDANSNPNMKPVNQVQNQPGVGAPPMPPMGGGMPPMGGGMPPMGGGMPPPMG